MQDEEFVKKAQESMTESWKMINSEGWKDEKKTPEGDLVQSKIVRRTHKIFKITVITMLGSRLEICILTPIFCHHNSGYCRPAPTNSL